MKQAPVSFVFTLDMIHEVVERLKPLVQSYRIMTFSGQLGAGKTTLIKHLVASFGYRGVVSSPTFTYLQLYACPNGTKICHFDLYRITSIDQFFELGLDEFLFDQKTIVLIEWPERIADLLKTISHISATLAWVEGSPEKRLITVL